MGGHHLTGHIDVCGKVRAVRADENNRELEIACGTEWTRYLVAKGWIAVDGISLTVVDVLNDGFTVCLIPETLDRTLMEIREEGDAVNLEFDHSSKVIIGTIERMLPELEQRLLKKIQG
jgi:riboflavin synthase